MTHRVFTNNGYIESVLHNTTEGNITEAEYLAIMEAIKNKPSAPNGYDYRLTVGLEWELFELPIPDGEEEDETATENDYQEALESLGVSFNA